jgi:hypothetical protein
MDSPRNDPFRHALTEVRMQAPPDFVESVREKLRSIRESFPHKESTVNSCLRGLEEKPTLMEILVAAYVLNGGVSLKFQIQEEAATDERDLEQLISEISEVWADSGKNEKKIDE